MLNNFFSLLLLSILLFSCNDDPDFTSGENHSYTETKDEQITSTNLDWIEGNWIDTNVRNGKIVFCENWRKISENSFEGEKFQISLGDSSSPTKLSLTKTDGKYYYSYFDNEDQTTFIQDSLGDGYMSFVNTTENFPTNLSYEWNTKILKISFSGMVNGVYRSASFNTIKND